MICRSFQRCWKKRRLTSASCLASTLFAAAMPHNGTSYAVGDSVLFIAAACLATADECNELRMSRDQSKQYITVRVDQQPLGVEGSKRAAAGCQHAA